MWAVLFGFDPETPRPLLADWQPAIFLDDLPKLRSAVEAAGSAANPGSPHVFLRAVPIRDDRFKTSTIGGIHIDGDPGAHPADSHPRNHTGIRFRTLSSDFIH